MGLFCLRFWHFAHSCFHFIIAIYHISSKVHLDFKVYGDYFRVSGQKLYERERIVENHLYLFFCSSTVYFDKTSSSNMHTNLPPETCFVRLSIISRKSNYSATKALDFYNQKYERQFPAFSNLLLLNQI